MIYTLVINGSTDFITFDSVTTFRESISANISNYPVETGYPISDSMVMNLPSFNLSGIITTYGIGEREIVLTDGEFVLADGSETADKAKLQIDAEYNIRRLIEEKLPFSIYKSTKLDDPIGSVVEEIKNCVCDNIEFPYEAGRSGAIFPTLSIKKLFITSVSVEATPNATPELIKNRVATTTAPAATSSGTSTSGKDVKNPDGSTKQPNTSGKGVYDPVLTKDYAETMNGVDRNISLNSRLDKIYQDNADLGYNKYYYKTLPDGTVQIIERYK